MVALGYAEQKVTDPIPRTIPERYLDWRLSRRVQKKAKADSFAISAEQIHQEDDQEYIESVRHAVTRSFLKPITKNPKPLRVPGPIAPKEGLGKPKPGMIIGKEKHEPGVWGAIKGNTIRLFFGAGIPGTSPLRRKYDKTVLAMDALRPGMTADEIRDKKQAIDAAPGKPGGTRARISRRKQRKQEELTENAANQPIFSAIRRKRLSWKENKILKLEKELGIEKIEISGEKDRAETNWDRVIRAVAERNREASKKGFEDGLWGLKGVMWYDENKKMFYQVTGKNMNPVKQKVEGGKKFDISYDIVRYRFGILHKTFPRLNAEHAKGWGTNSTIPEAELQRLINETDPTLVGIEKDEKDKKKKKK